MDDPSLKSHITTGSSFYITIERTHGASQNKEFCFSDDYRTKTEVSQIRVSSKRQGKRDQVSLLMCFNVRIHELGLAFENE